MNASPHDRDESIRRKLEDRRRRQASGAETTDDADMAGLIEDLEQHQIELVQANEELRESQLKLEETGKRYFDLYDLAPVGYLTLNAGGMIISANLAAADLLGTVRTRLASRPLSGYVHPDSMGHFVRRFQTVKKTQEATSCEIRLKTSEDHVKWVQLTCTARRLEAGDQLAIWIAMTDITRLKQLENEREHLNRVLRQYSRDLELSNKELEAFNDSVSHDLRAPVRNIGAFTEFLAKELGDSISEKARDYLNRISRSVHHMDRLITGLADLSRLSRAELKRTNVDLSQLAREIAVDLKEQNPKRNVVFIIPDSLPVIGGPRLLRIALDNLIGNAWKFTQRADPARIELGERVVCGERCYYVSDNGVGFDPQYSDKLFKPFQRLHTGSEFAGIGIGLATVDRVVRMHGGRIWAASEKDRGATFYFTVPAEAEE